LEYFLNHFLILLFIEETRSWRVRKVESASLSGNKSLIILATSAVEKHVGRGYLFPWDLRKEA
jgi:hypothetical protein